MEVSEANERKKVKWYKLLTKPIILFMIINGLGFSSVQAFYPNLSKFFQTRFQFSNVHAGFISSLPYMIASFSVPFFGGLTSYLGDAYFELILFSSISLILACHIYYLRLNDVTEIGAVGGWDCILPMIPFGFGHALFTTT